MGALSFDALLRSLKHGAPSPVYYLHGDEEVLKAEAVRAVVERAVDPGARDFNLDDRSAPQLTVETFRALVDTPPMLAPMRAVIIRGVDQVKKTTNLYRELVRYVAAPNPTTVLVLVQGSGEDPDPAIAREATAVAVLPLAPDRVSRWMAHQAGRLGVSLEPEATELLLEVAAGDLGAIARELEKLAGLVAQARAVTRADVAALAGVRHGETLADLIQAAFERRTADAVRLVEPVLEQAGMTGVRIVSALGTALIGTALARAEADRGTPPARLADVVFRHMLTARPFGIVNWKEEAARWARWASLWSGPALRRALRLTLEADRALKSSTLSDDAGLVRELLLTWAVRTRVAA